MAASGALDMTLDDLIKSRKSTSGNSRGRGRGFGPGPTRRINNRAFNRTSPYTASKAPDSTWQHDMFVDQPVGFTAQPVRVSAIETGTKLYISNLDYGVSNEDIKELFAEVGDLKRFAIHYDRSGRSKGTAEVVFSRRADALSAVKRYNDVQLDGKPMKIEIIGTNIPTPASYAVVDDAFGSANGVFGSANGFFGSAQLRGGMGRRGRGGRGGVRGFRRGRGRGGGRGAGENASADDLDADLDKYHSEAMQTN